MPTTEIPHALATRFVALDVHRQYLMAGRGGSCATRGAFPSALWLCG
jgi:hypothetical protein